MQGTGHTFISLTPSQEAALLPHPSCCHVNHRPTGSLLFTLVSLPPKFDYCNCLLTVCSAGFHTSSSCQGQEQGAASLILKRGTLPTHRDNTIASCLSVTPKPLIYVPTPRLLLSYTLPGPLILCPWSSLSRWSFHHGFLWSNSAHYNYPRLQ